MFSLAKRVIVVAAIAFITAILVAPAISSSQPGMFFYPVKASLQEVTSIFSTRTVIWVPVEVPQHPLTSTKAAAPAPTIDPSTPPSPSPTTSLPRPTGAAEDKPSHLRDQIIEPTAAPTQTLEPTAVTSPTVMAETTRPLVADDGVTDERAVSGASISSSSSASGSGSTGKTSEDHSHDSDGEDDD